MGQGEARAAAILSIRDFTQSVGTSYNYHRSDSSAAGSVAETGQTATEDYSTGFSYVLLAPHLLRGNCMLDLEWQQDSEKSAQGNTDSSQFQLRYNVNGGLLSGGAYPVSFSAGSTRETVSLPFTPTFQSEHEDLSARISLLNDFVPSDIAYSQQSQVTSGLLQNVNQQSHSVNFGARPTLGDAGSLTLGVSLSESDSTVVETGATSNSSSASSQAGYHNSWRSKQNLARSFSLVYGYQQIAGATSLNQQNLNGGLNWQFGKVLEGGLSYFSSKSSSQTQTTQAQGVTGLMTHSLMGSLTTSVFGAASTEEFERGDSVSYSGGINFGYSKKLPEGSSLSLGYSYGMNLNERMGEVNVVVVSNEKHAIPVGMLLRITLDTPTFMAETIRVMGAQTQLPYPDSYFMISQDGIELLDYYALDTEVLVSYSYRQDPALTTLGTSHSLNGALSLYGNKYRIYASAKTAGQKLLDGDATALTLTSSRHVDLGATANLDGHGLAAEFGYDHNYAQDLYYLNSSWGYSTPFKKGDLGLGANDRYTWQTYSGEGAWANSFNMQANYRRRFGVVAGKFKASYANAAFQGGDPFHMASLNASLEGKVGRLIALLNASANWSFTAGGNSSSQGISVALRRSF